METNLIIKGNLTKLSDLVKVIEKLQCELFGLSSGENLVSLSHIFVVDLQLLGVLIKFKPRFRRIPGTLEEFFLK